ncbi:triose-phosphate isomerase [Kangiella sp. HZ709]|uniref:triose-phosphate isomerase n=1 Tax=Kangiella sp. HZ709 TaxID=2666328 RepID=UPI0012B1404A|nr:triose-phosphate isomerase [Kangiella sp. HZ709]MRX27766.1 triose-phosphate isomerase [Kangiella sp. HZ709]
MTRQTLIAGNWKMNGDSQFIGELMSDIKGRLDSDWQHQILVSVPSLYLTKVKELAADTNIAVGAQNLSQQSNGAFTGEISGSMLADVNCQYVLVGHSERRSLYGESSTIVAEKYQAALDNDVVPVLCIGETLEEREAGTTMTIVKGQLDAVIEKSGIESIAQGVIAYEPVWAIGTGKTATPEQAQEVHAEIRAHLAQFDVDVAEQTQILYGGSMNPTNAEQLLAQADIDGGLIGGASLKAEQFIAICKAAG